MEILAPEKEPYRKGILKFSPQDLGLMRFALASSGPYGLRTGVRRSFGLVGTMAHERTFVGTDVRRYNDLGHFAYDNGRLRFSPFPICQ